MSDYAARRTMMVDTQVRPSDVTKFPVIAAMLEVPRESYLPRGRREEAYVSNNVALTEGRVMLEPRTFAKLLDALDIEPNELILDIGCGLGYSTAIIAKLGQAVVAIEQDDDMATEAETMLLESGVDNAAVVKAELNQGMAKHGPYDVIMLQGGVEQVPETILDQLKEGGRIGAIFMENALGVVRVGYKVDGKMNWRFSFNASAPVLPGYAHPQEFKL